MLSISAKQKTNTLSLTEVEFVGVDAAMTFVIWIKHFFESQVKSINVNSLLKPLESDVTIEQGRMDENQVVKKPNTSTYDTFITLKDSNLETSAELSTS